MSCLIFIYVVLSKSFTKTKYNHSLLGSNNSDRNKISISTENYKCILKLTDKKYCEFKKIIQVIGERRWTVLNSQNLLHIFWHFAGDCCLEIS